MPQFHFTNIPNNVSESLLQSRLQLLESYPAFENKEFLTLNYLGGITNHGLNVEELGLFVRVPGGNSDYFIDRVQEKNTLLLLASSGLYSKDIDVFTEGPLAGFKIEPFLEGETLQFTNFYEHQHSVLSELHMLHNADIQFKNTYDIFEKLLAMISVLESKEQNSIAMLQDESITCVSINEIKSIISELQFIQGEKYSCSKLLPCHNDITPTNFIKLKSPKNSRHYQLVDWEYAGMNDPMYDVASIAAMLAVPLENVEPLVCQYYQEIEIDDLDKQIQTVQFYTPIVKLYYAIWGTLQVLTGNESSSLNELKEGWGPESLTVFLNQYHSDFYQNEIINNLLSSQPRV